MSAEQIREQEPRQIHALIRVGITIVIGNATIGDPEHLTSHVSQEARLLIRLLSRANVREQLL